jgi:glycosyltransferase involved in cell wall biosynthesis
VRVLRSTPRTHVYHCLFTPNPRTSLALKLVLGSVRRPVVHTLCSSPEDWSTLPRLLFADRVVTVSAWAARQLEERGVRGVVHIRPGIAAPRPAPAAIAAMRERHDLPASRPCLVFPGDYEYSRAHTVLLEALPQILRSRPTPIVVFACRTKSSEALAIETAVRQDVDSAGLLPHVRFLREVADFESLLAVATLILFPVQSLRRKMDIPLTLLQALALRRPIVTTTLGPLTELLTRTVGLGVAPGDAVEFAAAVTALLDDPDRMKAMGNEGYELVREQYTAERMAADYERLYVSLAENGGAR